MKDFFAQKVRAIFRRLDPHSSDSIRRFSSIANYERQKRLAKRKELAKAQAEIQRRHKSIMQVVQGNTLENIERKRSTRRRDRIFGVVVNEDGTVIKSCYVERGRT